MNTFIIILIIFISITIIRNEHLNNLYRLDEKKFIKEFMKLDSKEKSKIIVILLSQITLYILIFISILGFILKGVFIG